MELTPRRTGTVALLTLLPTVIFGMTKNPLTGIVTAVNVLLISTTIYLLMNPTEGGYGHDGGADPETDVEHAA